MPDFYLTFGTAHTRELHPHLVVDARPDGYVTIEADDYSTARATAIYLCRTHWCWLYLDSDDMHAEPQDAEPRREGLGALVDSFITPVLRRRYFPAGELARYRARVTRLTADATVLDVDLTNLPLGPLAQK